MWNKEDIWRREKQAPAHQTQSLKSPNRMTKHSLRKLSDSDTKNGIEDKKEY